MDDAQLRAAYAEAVARRGGAGRADCPPPETVLALVRREGREAGRLSTVNHVMGCAECRREFELLRSLDGAGAADARHAGARTRWRSYAGAAIAASVLLAISLGPGRLWEREDSTRAGGDEVRSVAPAVGEVVRATSAAPVVFSWHVVPGARRYALEVIAADGMEAYSGETADTVLTLPAAGALAPGDYQWWVTAQVEDGSERRSVARRLRVVP